MGELSENLLAKYGNKSILDFDDLAKTSRNALQNFMRWALVGGRPGPTIVVTMVLLGRDISLRRIEDAAALLGSELFDQRQA